MAGSSENRMHFARTAFGETTARALCLSNCQRLSWFKRTVGGDADHDAHAQQHGLLDAEAEDRVPGAGNVSGDVLRGEWGIGNFE